MTTTYARIAGTGSYLPDKIVTNADLEKMVDTNDAWIVDRTGIKQRHIAADGQLTCDMAEIAARRAIEMAGISPQAIDLIIIGTTTPDKFFPSTATLLQERLGNVGCPAFDVQAVCTGFIYGLSIADKFIRTGAAKNALVIGADIFSRIIDWTDRNTCVLFGDGAGAVVLSANQEVGILSTHLYADGRHHEQLHVPGYVKGGKVQAGNAFASMQGTEVFKFAVNNMAHAAEEALKINDLKINDVDWLIPHQANKRILSAVAKRLKFPEEKVIVTVDLHGNTSAASVPLALDTAVRDGRIKRGETLLLEAMGGGFTWGSALLTY
ncbi:MAG: beta-ketoacyl-ACP synthase [Pseudomonadota bacterium]|jgi:3-oxoacyl-[acyl-carrier-protein] synthase-3